MRYEIPHSEEVKKAILQLEVAFVIDTTASMAGQINEAKRRLKEIVDAIVSHELRPRAKFAVIGFRDHPPQDDTYVARAFCNLESDVSRVQAALNSMSADGGGDVAEAVADGINLALDLGWTLIAQKVILLVGDSPPHGEGDDNDAFPSGCPCGHDLSSLADEIREMAITAHAIGATSNPAMVRSFSKFARECGGVFVNIDKSADLIPIMLRRIGEEMRKIADDLKTIRKIEMHGSVADEDRESLKRLEEKGVRVITTPLPTESPAPRKLRIRVIR
ncbi:MAG: vWA domain-containing protein [Blastocatellia bacterium]